MFSLWNYFLKTHTSNMNIGKMYAHIRIPFIGTNHNFTSFSNGKINSCQSYFSG